MQISEPFINIRPPHYGELRDCCALVLLNWGKEASERCRDQFIEYFRGGTYAPVFLVAVDEKDMVIGFAAYHRTMQCTFNIIWLAVTDRHKGRGVGKHLLHACINGVEDHDGMLIEVITQLPEFYMRHGFTPGENLGNGWWLQLRPLGEFGL